MKRIVFLSTVAAVALGTGCRQLPGTPEQQGAVIGGTGGAIAGAAVSDNKLLGALIGGAVGAGGGYLIGANRDRIVGKDRDAARVAVENAQANPATADQARLATTADVNADGFVTLDEVTAMKEAGLSDEEILSRLRATDQVFELTAAQERQLMARGLSRATVTEMRHINRDTRERLLRGDSDVISRPAPVPAQ